MTKWLKICFMFANYPQNASRFDLLIFYPSEKDHEAPMSLGASIQPLIDHYELASDLVDLS